MALPISARQSILDATVNLMAAFRAWCRPETEQIEQWRKRKFSEAVAACKSSMVDDVESMLASWRKQVNADVKAGGTAFIPVMLVAVSAAVQPPDVSMIFGVPYWVDVISNIDGVDYQFQMRTIPKAMRVQMVYASTNPHDAQSLSDQFCAFFTDDMKRRFDVQYNLGKNPETQQDIIDINQMTIIENSLFPDIVPTDQKNLTIISVDFTMVGLVPQFALDDTDIGYDEFGMIGGTNGGQNNNRDLVITADLHDQDTKRHFQVNADPNTGVITETIEPNDP